MKKLTISVAMATYNGERFLQKQLDSLARQTMLPCELVACDDGSTDGTIGILREYAKDAPFPVRIYQNETRLGYRLNFLRAASLCSGELIAFCDQDDVWLEQKLQRCAALIFETGSNLVIHSAEVVDELLNPTGRKTFNLGHPVVLDAASGRGWHTPMGRLRMRRGFAFVFRASLLRQVPPDPPLSGPQLEHEYWALFAAEVTGSITLMPDVLVLYRQHGRNAAGFRADPGLRETYAPAAKVGEVQYRHQAETTMQQAKLLREAAERSPELQQRLSRAAQWYEARAESLVRRAELYSAGPSFPAVTRRLLSMVIKGTYRAIPRGGLGLRGFSKDLLMPLLQRTVKKPQDGSELSQRLGPLPGA